MGMPMGHGGGRAGGSAGWSVLRSFRRDDSVTEQQLPPGSCAASPGSPAPTVACSRVFLGLIVFEALLGAANPLILRSIIDDGIRKGRTGLIVKLALLVAVSPSSTRACRCGSAGSPRASARA